MYIHNLLTKCQVFIAVCAVGVVWVWVCLPETKGIPLEEVAALFGDQDEVMVLSHDIQVDPNSEEVAVREHDQKQVASATTTHAEKVSVA